MFDARIRPLIDPPLARLARAAVNAGWTADGVTLGGFAIGLLAIPAIAFEAYLIGLAFILLNRLADGLDGAIARITEKTDRGGFLDICLDFIFYSSIPFAFALADSFQNALPAAFLIFAFIGTGCSFLAYAIMADRHGLSTDIRGRKSFYYLGRIDRGDRNHRAFRARLSPARLVPGACLGFRDLLLDHHGDPRPCRLADVRVRVVKPVAPRFHRRTCKCQRDNRVTPPSTRPPVADCFPTVRLSLTLPCHAASWSMRP